MKRILLLVAAATLAVPIYIAPQTATAAEASAAPAQEQARYRVYRGRTYHPTYSHPQYYRRYQRVYQPQYTYSYYYSPPVVYSPPTVIMQPAPVVVPQPVYVEQPVYVQQPVAQATPVVYEAPAEVVVEQEQERYGAAIAVFFAGQNQADTDISFETIRGMGLLGMGAALRFDFDPHWTIELASNIMAREDEYGITQWSIPVTAALMAHLFPDSIIDPFALAGLGVVFNEYDDPNYGVIENYTQFEGILGFGADLNLGDRFFITSDMRFAFLQARPDREYSTSYAGLDGGTVTVRDDGAYQDPYVTGEAIEEPDSVTTAFQLNIGAGWRF